jgi:hypothetical protein
MKVRKVHGSSDTFYHHPGSLTPLYTVFWSEVLSFVIEVYHNLQTVVPSCRSALPQKLIHRPRLLTPFASYI